MGYTHYYSMKRDMDDGEFAAFKKDLEILMEALPPTVGEFAQRYGEFCSEPAEVRLGIEEEASDVRGNPLGEKIVGFNGSGGEALGHETFWVPQKMDLGAASWELASMKEDGRRFLFTKTAQKPYDAMVCAALLCLKQAAPDAWEISSDGSVMDWAPAARFVSMALGRRPALEEISSFAKRPDLLAKALEPTAWMRSQSDKEELGKAACAGAGKRQPGI